MAALDTGVFQTLLWAPVTWTRIGHTGERRERTRGSHHRHSAWGCPGPLRLGLILQPNPAGSGSNRQCPGRSRGP